MQMTALFPCSNYLFKYIAWFAYFSCVNNLSICFFSGVAGRDRRPEYTQTESFPSLRLLYEQTVTESTV